jgi:hypothetical protein
MTISFVIDGSDSMKEERDKLAYVLIDLLNNLEDLMPIPGTQIDAKVYVLGIEENLCNGFDSGTCRIIGFDELYSTQDIINTPHEYFGESYGQFSSYSDWLAIDPQASENDYARSDWIAGMVVAHQEYLKTHENPTVNILVPISDEMSSSSQADECFGIPTNDPSWISFIDYYACSLCETTCPIDRQKRNLEEFKEYMKESAVVIIPISSFDDTFNYEEVLEDASVTDYSSKFTTCSDVHACQGSILCDNRYRCEGCQCTDCESPDDRKVGVNPECRQYTRELMDEIAQEFYGDMIDIRDIDELDDMLEEHIDAAVDSLTLEVGEREDERTRYIYERVITLPNKNSGEINLWIYENPFEEGGTEWAEPEEQGPGLVIVRPAPDSPYSTDRAFELVIRTGHDAICTGEGMGYSFNFETDDDGLVHLFGPIPADGSDPIEGEYTFTYTCTGNNPPYILTETVEHTFWIESTTCQENFGITCAPNQICTTGFVTEWGSRCCLFGECQGCEEVGTDCSENQYCKDDNWIYGDEFDFCCGNSVCGTCESEGYNSCASDQVCDEGDSQIQKNFGDKCCTSNDCRTCDDAFGRYCSDTQSCEGDSQETDDGLCCFGECTDCLEECDTIQECKAGCPACTFSDCEDNGQCDFMEPIGENCMSTTDCTCANGECCGNCENTEEDGCCIEGYFECNGACIPEIETPYNEGHDCECEGQCRDDLSCNFKADGEGKACCPPGKKWDESQSICVEPEICDSFSTRCYNRWWPNHYGGSFKVNDELFYCDTYEVCQDDIVPIVEEIINCCDNMCSGVCHSGCNRALQDSGLNLNDNEMTRKKCYAFYTAYAMDRDRWMHGYWNDEIDCKGIGGTCSLPADAMASSVECQGSIGIGNSQWKNDNDMDQNSCFFGEPPAHASLAKLKIGTCADYSIAMTTLLRSVGYEEDEIYSTCAPGHMYNLIKLPGESKYRFIDTSGGLNKLYFAGYENNNWAWQVTVQENTYIINHCDYGYGCGGCTNDGGSNSCPSKSNVLQSGGQTC